MDSLWRATQPASIPSDPFEPGASYDTVVAGAGLTGLTTALLLARAGQSVAVLEARSVGAVTTGASTAKLSLLHGGALAKIRAHTSDAVLDAYVTGNREGQQWLLRYLTEHGVAAEERDAFSYATTPDGAATLEADLAACRIAGLDAVPVTETGLPFETTAAIQLRHQAQVNPVEVMRALAQDIRERGGAIIERTRVTGVDVGAPSSVRTSRGEVRAAHLVLATGTPILDRGLYFAKTRPLRSYALALRVPGAPESLPPGMYLSLDTPTRSLRTARVGGEDRLLVGGNGHHVGRMVGTQRAVEQLEAWAIEHFPGAERTHAWSAQDYESMNRIPFVGWMPRTGKRVSLATGYNKWGMTNAVAAALSITADLLGGQFPWAETMHHRVTRPRDIGSAISTNAAVAAEAAGGWVQAELTPLPHDPPEEGSGVVGNHGLKPAAVSQVDGTVCRLSAVCPHLGGIVTWNDAEQSWDCPLHGSRFRATGELLEGPATEGLEPLP